ncbi:MAG: conjugal transfer protein [Actinomycetota bacterium]|nr:conjugal transfer protein [Actinomycetota bacterium]
MTELPTYTSVFRLERRLYAIYDWELPIPVGLAQAGTFLAAVTVFWVLGRLLGIELTAGSAWFYLVPPAFVSYLARMPLADHKQPHRWLASQVRYLLEPRVLLRLAEPREPAVVTVRASVWRERPRR